MPTIFEAHSLIADWFDEYAHRKQKNGHLKGKRPIDVFLDGKGPGLTLEQQAELKLLMMPIKETWIKRNGSQLPGRAGAIPARELAGLLPIIPNEDDEDAEVIHEPGKTAAKTVRRKRTEQGLEEQFGNIFIPRHKMAELRDLCGRVHRVLRELEPAELPYREDKSAEAASSLP